MRLRVQIAALLASFLANTLASETGHAEERPLSPLAQSIISMTLSSAGNPTVMRRDVSGHSEAHERSVHGAAVREQQPVGHPSLSSVEAKVARKFRRKARHALSGAGDDETEEELSETTLNPELGEDLEVAETSKSPAEETTQASSTTVEAVEESSETTEAPLEEETTEAAETTTEESAEASTSEEEEPESTESTTSRKTTTSARNKTTPAPTTTSASNTTKASTASTTKSTETTKKTTTSTTTKSTTKSSTTTTKSTTTETTTKKSTTSKSTTKSTSRATTTQKSTTHRTTSSKNTHASTSSTTTRHVEVVALPTAAPAAPAPVPTTTTGPSFFYLQALEVAEAAARAAADAGLPPATRAARAGEAAFDSAQSSALTDLECVRAAGAAAAAAAHAAGLTAEEQVRTAVLAAEAAAQKAGLLPEKEATAAAKAALAAAKATGLPAEEQAALAGRVVASVRQSLQKALAVKIQEIHQKTLAARATPAPTAKMSDAEAVAAAVAAARSAMDAAQAADAAAREAVATAVSANGTLNASLLPGAGPLAAAATAGGGEGGGGPGGPVGGPAGLSPGAPSAPTQGGEEPHLSAIEAILRKLSETVASYSLRIDASNSRLDKVEDVERALVRELGSARAGPRSSNFTGEASEEPSGVAEATEAQEIPFERPAKIPPHMNGTGKPRYWTHGNNGAAESVSQKPIHPHTQEDAILSTEEVLALGPDEVAQVLSHDRKLLATVTARLSSGKELADLVFGTDSSELPEGRPTEKALDAILNDPDVAKKAINLTMTTLHRGVSKLASGKSFADELFGSDTSRLIGEAFHPTEPPEPIEEAKPVTEAPRQAAPVTGRKVAGAGGAVLPPVPKAKEADKEEGRTTPAPEEKRGGLKMLGVEMPGLPSLPGLPVNLPDMPELPLQLPHVPNPLDWLR